MAQRKASTLSDDELYADWVRWIKRAHDESVMQAWRHRNFRLMRGIAEQNTRLRETGGFFLQWAAQNYLAAAAIAFRRELDTQRGTENLFHVLTEMHQRPRVVSRERFVATWGPSNREFSIPDRAFNSYPIIKDRNGDSRRDHLDPAYVANDLTTLQKENERILEYVQTTVAHRAPEKPKAEVPTFGDFHAALAAVQEVIGRYYTFLTHSTIINFEPTAQYDVHEPFTFAWISNPTAFNFSAAE
jgi:hypothetical protein